MNHKDLWNGPIHQAYLDSLSESQLTALWELLLVATLADDTLSIEERREIASAVGSVPQFEAFSDLTANASAELERLYTAYDEDAAGLLQDIAARLGSESARRGAFRSAVELVKSDGLVPEEIEFVHHLGELLGLEPEVIEFSLSGPQ